MSDVATASRPRTIPSLPFLVALGLITVLFVLLAIRRSNRTSLRGDELYTVLWTRDESSVTSMLRDGVRGEISPSPTYYVLERFVDGLRYRVDYLGLNYSAYFRLMSILFTAGFGTAAALLLGFRLARMGESADPLAGLLVLCGLAAYWFQPKMFSFACTARNYAGWNGLWLLTLVWLLCRPSSRVGLSVLLSLLATVATAACFQIFAVGIAFAITRRLEGRSVPEILREGVFIFALPALIAVYYGVRAPAIHPEESEDPVAGLLRFWLVTNLPAWIAAAFAGILVLRRPATRPLVFPVAAFSVLLLIVPLIFALARLKGYSSPSRHYIWTTTGIPLSLFVAAQAGARFPKGRTGRIGAGLLAVALAAGFGVATALRPHDRNDARKLACLDRGSPLEELLRRERPCFLAFPQGESGENDRKNVRLLGEWIGRRYGRLGVGTRIAPLRVVGDELRSEATTESSEPPKGYVLVATPP